MQHQRAGAERDAIRGHQTHCERRVVPAGAPGPLLPPPYATAGHPDRNSRHCAAFVASADAEGLLAQCTGRPRCRRRKQHHPVGRRPRPADTGGAETARTRRARGRQIVTAITRPGNLTGIDLPEPARVVMSHIPDFATAGRDGERLRRQTAPDPGGVASRAQCAAGAATSSCPRPGAKQDRWGERRAERGRERRRGRAWVWVRRKQETPLLTWKGGMMLPESQ